MRYSEIFESPEDEVKRLKKTIASLQRMADHPSTDTNEKYRALQKLPIFKKKLADAEARAKGLEKAETPASQEPSKPTGMVYNNKGKMQSPGGRPA